MSRGATFAACIFLRAAAMAVETKSIPVTSQPCCAMYIVFVPVPQPRSRALPGVRACGPSISSFSSRGGMPESQGLKPNRYMARNMRFEMLVAISGYWPSAAWPSGPGPRVDGRQRTADHGPGRRSSAGFEPAGEVLSGEGEHGEDRGSYRKGQDDAPAAAGKQTEGADREGNRQNQHRGKR